MRVALLGPVRAQADDGTPIDIGGPRLRMLLARLALDAGRTVGADTLIDGLWGAEPPTDAANALQSLVSRLRRALGGAGTIASGSGGYTLDADVDAQRFEELAARGRRGLAAGRAGEAAAVLGEALALWRGDALADVLDAPFAPAPVARLEELRIAAVEDRFEAELALGRHAEVLADLDAAGEAHPLRERLASLRMLALAASGRQADALAVFERIRATLAEELGVDPSAELRDAHLKVLRGEVAPPRAEPTLPVRLTSFVGRERELDQVARALSASRLVTLVGPGGAGKTRLATEAAERHPARAWFVALAGVRDADDVPGAILGALGPLDLRVTSAPKVPVDAMSQIVALLDGGDAVLVLDNCEHVVDAVADVAFELLARVPGLRILATSREPLAITGESLCQVGPLEVPEAVRLFTERAVAVRPGFVLDESTSDAVEEICRSLDGMPLALELAAARLRSMTADQIARRLDDRFRLLNSGSRTAMPRQRTLRAVVEWSWDLLEKPERILARRLSVFPGGATVASAEAVCADELLPAEDVLYVLGSLVEKSIVDAGSTGGEPRYRMLETIRAYGAERLAESGEQDDVVRRFTGFFADLAEENDPKLRGHDQVHALETFGAEHDNIMAAVRRALDDQDSGTAARLVLATLWYWVIRGFNAEPAPLLEEVLRHDGLPDHAHACLAVMHTLMTSLPLVRRDDVPELAVECVRSGAVERYPMLALALPMTCFLGGHRDLAEREVQRVLRGSDPWMIACASWAEGFLADQDGDLDRSGRARDRGLAGFRECGDRWGTSMTVAMQAEAHSLRGDHSAAIAGFEEGLRMARELSSADDVVQQLTRLAEERLRAGDAESAWRDIAEAERLAGDKVDRRAMVALRKFDMARRCGELEVARAEHAWLTANAARVPFPVDMAGELVATTGASLLVTEGRPAEAWPLLPGPLRSASERRDLPDVAKTVVVVARAFHAEGDAERAAWALGLSAAIRGVFDAGDPELRAVIDSLRESLGADAYEEAYQRGARLTGPRAIAAIKSAVADRVR
ncbi:SARP family transcriptional regulator [Amycolatopsis deserti]|uniref:SARP family transcriptional regulator n=1 Tax=Amycolatopsis deserti TaxID=185696 RepID=A0ABQ3J7S1_9PSEU|nr:BTAD domain-containing putative transcriptional regulator [Amycolatopsis deserti]GHF03069.1 SARP family transcriptional regulator [Amycolatopsis deserti]